MAETVQPIIAPDYDQAVAHLSLLFGEATTGRIEIAWTDASPPHALKHASTFDVADLDEAATLACEKNQDQGVNVYVGAALRDPDVAPFGRCEDADFHALWAFYVDLDAEGAADRAKDIYGADGPNAAVVTGRQPYKRAQLWWALDEPITDPDDYRRLIGSLASNLNGDSTVTNPSRVMRLGGTVAWPVKAGRVLERTEFIKLPGRRVYTAQEITRIFPQKPQELAETGIPVSQQPIDRIGDLGDHGRSDTVLDQMLEAAQTAGQWHYNMLQVTATLIGRNHSDWAIRRIVAPYCAAGANDPDLDPLLRGGREKFNKPDPGEVDSASDILTVGPDGQPTFEITAAPLHWIDPAQIPPRQWLYGRHMIRKHMSITVAPGGVGKSSLLIAETLAMVTGKELLGHTVTKPLRVWYLNLEDDLEELSRRFAAAALHYSVDPEAWGDRLLVTGSETRLITTVTAPHGGYSILHPVTDAVVAELDRLSIDLIIIDPFVSSHEIQENDNSAIDAVAKEWARIAVAANAGVELVHHTRKSGGEEITDESARGGKALVDASRSSRVLNRMTPEQGGEAGVENHLLYFRTGRPKANMQPPEAVSDWYQLVGVGLGNGGLLPGDQVGVVTPWEWPDVFNGLTREISDLIFNLIRGGLADGEKYSQHNRSKERYVYEMILSETELTKAEAKNLISTWLKNDVIYEDGYESQSQRKSRTGLFVNESNRPFSEPKS